MFYKTFKIQLCRGLGEWSGKAIACGSAEGERCP